MVISGSLWVKYEKKRRKIFHNIPGILFAAPSQKLKMTLFRLRYKVINEIILILSTTINKLKKPIKRGRTRFEFLSVSQPQINVFMFANIV